MEMKLLRNVDGYSYYENPDTELVAKILAFPSPKILKDRFLFKNDLDWQLKEITPKSKYLMESNEGDLMTITSEDYYSLISEIHLKNINEAFLISDTFNKYFAPFKNGSSIITAMTDEHLQLPMRKESFYCGVNHIFVNENWSTYAYDTRYLNGTKVMKIDFTLGSNNGNGHMYFTAQGEITNRDYNQNFNDPKPFVSKIDSINQFIKELDKRLPNKIEQSGKFYYINGYVIRINEPNPDDWFEKRLSVKFIPEQSADTFYVQGESSSKIKKPKKGVVEIEKQQVLSEVTELLFKIIER